MWHIYTIEYHLSMRKEEILPFEITQLDLKGIMLSEISQRRHILCDLIYMWSLKELTLQNQGVKWWLPGAEGNGEILASIQKMNTFWGSKVQDSNYSQQYCIIYLKFAKCVYLKWSHHKKEIVIV